MGDTHSMSSYMTYLPLTDLIAAQPSYISLGRLKTNNTIRIL